MRPQVWVQGVDFFNDTNWLIFSFQKSNKFLVKYERWNKVGQQNITLWKKIILQKKMTQAIQYQHLLGMEKKKKRTVKWLKYIAHELQNVLGNIMTTLRMHVVVLTCSLQGPCYSPPPCPRLLPPHSDQGDCPSPEKTFLLCMLLSDFFCNF